MIQAEDLSHHYGERLALEGVNFRVSPGEIFGLLGPNGGGKSTIFRILSTMMAPGGGRASVAGLDVVRQAAEVRRRIGVVFQSQSLDKSLTVFENLRSQGHLHGLSGKLLRERIEKVIRRLNIADRAQDLVQTLSGGLKRRVEIAKALLHQPEVLLMDEPSTGLDPGARRELWNFVQELRDQHGVTILLTTHILEEAERCDRLLLLHQGRIVAEGAPADLKAKIGGHVVVFESGDAARLSQDLSARFGVKPANMNGVLRVEIGNGHRFITEAVEAFPGAIESVALHKPTLEDVFVRETGVKIE
ncbi:MAG: ABC transporter ATP-binding protein [Acidobacteria bacterium]|nr:ABC transporter ATP-binding protein [Acidobacteriota bacterium]